MNRQIGKTEIFEWYDGIVFGLASVENLQALVCLLAFDPDANRKLYLLASVSWEQADMLRKLFAEHGLTPFNNDLISNILIKSDEMHLTSSPLEEGKMAALTPLTAIQRERLVPMSFPLIDAAVSSRAISEWLGDKEPS